MKPYATKNKTTGRSEVGGGSFEQTQPRRRLCSHFEWESGMCQLQAGPLAGVEERSSSRRGGVPSRGEKFALRKKAAGVAAGADRSVTG